MSQETNALPKGFELEEYRVESILGTGGFGITYKARDKLLDTFVAVKEYFPVEWSYRSHDGVGVNSNALGNAMIPEVQTSGYEWGLTRFLDEARVLAKVQHPYVVRIKRYFRAHGTAYIVMDFEEGEPLSALLKRESTLSETDLRGMLEEVLPALEAVHKEGYLHRDLKPSNLYIRSRDGAVMLIDFGAARQSLSRRSKSVTGLVTPGYSPPEQYVTRSDRYGPWTDIYALGAVLYRCVTGKAPTEAPDRQMWDTLPPAMEAGAGRYSPAFLAMVDKALAMRPEDRYQSIGEMLNALKSSAPLDVEKVPSRFSRPQGFTPTAEPAPKTKAPDSGSPYFRNFYRGSSQNPRSLPPGGAAPSPPSRKTKLPPARDDVTGQAEFEPLLPVLRSKPHFNKAPRAPAPDLPAAPGGSVVDIKPRLPGRAPVKPATEAPAAKSSSAQEPTDLALDPFADLLAEIPPPVTSLPDFDAETPPPTRLPGVEVEAPPAPEPATATAVQAAPVASPTPVEADATAVAPPADDVPTAPRRRRSGNWRLAGLLVLLLAALSWAIIDIYLDYRAQEIERAQAMLRQQQENARRVAAEQARRKQEEANRAQAEALVAQAREALLKRDLDKAEGLLKQAEPLFPTSAKLADARADLNNARQTIAALKTEVEPRLGMPLVWIREGCFQMGSPPEAEEKFANETPQHQVCVNGFWMSQNEVTNAQFRQFQPDHDSGAYARLSLNEDRQPVVDVTWTEATAFAAWLSRQTGKRYRLPTEAEWEYAARAETGGGRFWGDAVADACRYANGADQTARQAWGGAKTIHECNEGQAVAASVGSFLPNQWNLHDMLGNAAEWTCSDYAPYDRQGGVEKRCSSKDGNSGARAVRGGSWKDEPRLVRAANRDEKSPNTRDYGLGFRLVRED